MYLEGDQTKGWKEDQLNQLVDKMSIRVPPIDETDNSLWANLEREFKEVFTNINVKSDTYIELKKLKQGDCHRHEMCSNKSTRWVTCMIESASSVRIMS